MTLKRTGNVIKRVTSMRETSFLQEESGACELKVVSESQAIVLWTCVLNQTRKQQKTEAQMEAL